MVSQEGNEKSGRPVSDTLNCSRDSPAGIINNISSRTAVVIVFVLSFLCYLSSLDGTFVFDDTEAILNNEDVKPDTPVTNLFKNDFWGMRLTHNGSHKSYRPLTVLSFRFNCVIGGGLKPWGFHFANVFLHSLVSSLSVFVFRKFIGEKNIRLSFLCAIVFAIHPVHSESVAGIVGRADLLCSLFYFISFLFYVRTVEEQRNTIYLGISMLSCAVAMLCKEQGITVLGLNAVYDITVSTRLNAKRFWNDSRQWRNLDSLIIRHTVMLVTGLILLFSRFKIMGSHPPSFQSVDNPASFSPFLVTRVLSYNYVYSLHALLLVLPHWLCFDWSMGCVSLVEKFQDPRNLAALSLWIFIGSALWRAFNSSSFRQQRIITMAIATMIIPFLPATNIFFRVGFVVAERVLYIPAAGQCLLFVYGLDLLCRKLHRRIILSLFLLTLLFFGLKSANRSLDWTSESTLFRSALSVCPLNAKVHYNIAKNAADAGDADLAIQEYKRALELNPHYDQAMNNLANLLKDRGRIDEAEKLLLKAVEVRSDFAAAWMNLGIVQALLKKFQEARISYTTALTHRKRYPDCYYNLGNLYLELKKYDEAHEAFRSATSLQPFHVLAWTNLIVMLDNIGQSEKAETAAQEALQFLPNEPNIHFSLASMLGKQGRYAESELHFRRALDARPDNPSYHTNLGVLYHRWKRFDEAEQCYLRALSLQPGLKSAAENLKLLQKAKLGKNKAP